MWGGCAGSSHSNGPYWTSSTSGNDRNHAAVWLRKSAAAEDPPASCSEVLAQNPAAVSGRYTLGTAEGEIIVFCDFRGSEAYALVMLSNKGVTCPGAYATWAKAFDANIVTSSGYDTC